MLLFVSWYIIKKQISNPVAHNPKRVTQENPFKCVERPCKFERIFHEKSEEINSYFIHHNYAPIEFVIYIQEIVFQPCRKQSQSPCQFERIFHEKSQGIYFNFMHQNYAPIQFMIYNHEIEFQPCCTQSRTSSIRIFIQMRGTSMSIWKNISWQMRSNNLYFVHKNYALFWLVMNNHEIDFQAYCTQSQTCNTGKSIQMRWTSVSISKNLLWKITRNKFIFYTSKLCSYWVRHI